MMTSSNGNIFRFTGPLCGVVVVVVVVFRFTGPLCGVVVVVVVVVEGGGGGGGGGGGPICFARR